MPHHESETRVHLTLSGHRIEYRARPEVAAFLERFTSLADDPASTENDLVELGYSSENPILACAPYPSPLGWVTEAVLADPAYRVLTDLIFRKRIMEDRVDVERIAGQYTTRRSSAEPR